MIHVKCKVGLNVMKLLHCEIGLAQSFIEEGFADFKISACENV